METSEANHRARCLRWACLATLASLVWIWASVQIRFHGNWTGLYCAGSAHSVPPDLRSDMFVFPGPAGYDGQFYYYIAHAPFSISKYAAYLDAPRMRYRRILVPLAAWMLAFGQSGAIRYTYVAVVLMSVLAGAYWIGRFTRSPVWGSGFLFFPATLISLDRMTVDATMAAVTAGFVYYSARERAWKLYVVLMLATLVRETGFLLVAAWCIWMVWRREWRRAAAFATAAVPGLVWMIIVQLHTGPEAVASLSYVPFRAWVTEFLNPAEYPAPPVPAWVLQALDRLELIGILLAIVFAVSAGKGAIRIAAFLFGSLYAFMVLLEGRREMFDPFAVPRSFGPIFVLAALGGKPIAAAMPLPRIAVQLAGQLARAVTGG